MGHPSVLTGVGIIGSRAQATIGTSTDIVVNAELMRQCVALVKAELLPS